MRMSSGLAVGAVQLQSPKTFIRKTGCPTHSYVECRSSSEQLVMTFQCGHELRGGRGWIGNRLEKRVAVAAGENRMR